MANMSYCRFVNTYSDFLACLRAVESGEALSASELGYMQSLAELAERYVEAVENYEPEPEEEEDFDSED